MRVAPLHFINPATERKAKMKVKIHWKELARQLWNAVKPVLLGAVGGGLVAVTGSGCSTAART